MRHEPSVITWTVHCRSDQAARNVVDLLAKITQSDSVLTDEVRSFPGGVEQRREERHRIGDYFREIRWDCLANEQFSLRLVFVRSESSPRFWKDVMARLLQAVRNSGADVTIQRETDPAEKAAG
jgi:hypothetical protein